MGFKSGLDRVCSLPLEPESYGVAPEGCGDDWRIGAKLVENPIPAKIGHAIICCGAFHAPRAVYNSIMRLV